MTVKTTGKVFKDFWNDQSWWPEGCYVEDEKISVNGVDLGDEFDPDAIPDASLVCVTGGFVEENPKYTSLEKMLKDYIKSLSIKYVLVETPVDFDLKKLLVGTKCKVVL